METSGGKNQMVQTNEDAREDTLFKARKLTS